MSLVRRNLVKTVGLTLAFYNLAGGNVLFLDLEAYYTVTFLNTHEVYTLVQFSPYIFQKVCFFT